jgi:S-adenosylmethionine:tRNA ribosyltransferase-isomerase
MNQKVADIKISDYDYFLDDSRIAKHPIEQRDKCRLLVRDSKGNISHHIFSELPNLLQQDSMLVCNNTRVINARMHFKKQTGATIEIFCLEPILPSDYAQMFQTTVSCRWICLVGNLKRWKADKLSKIITLPDNKGIVNLTAEKVEPHGNNSWVIEFCWDNADITFASIIEAAGYIPIPPYLNRDSESTD